MANEKIHEYIDECTQNDLRNERVVFDVEVLTPSGWLSKQCPQSNILDVIIGSDTDTGLVLLKLTTAQILAIPSPTIGGLIYNTTINHVVYWTGLDWHKMNSSNM